MRSAEQLETKPSLERHQRKCVICNHPDRDEIEEAFLRWRSADDIAVDFDLEDDSSIYRHARALGLFEKRRANIRAALEHIIERAWSARVTADSVVHAIRAYCSINDSGQWIEQPAHVVHHASPSYLPAGMNPLPPAHVITELHEQSVLVASSSGDEISNRHSAELEIVGTD